MLSGNLRIKDINQAIREGPGNAQNKAGNRTEKSGAGDRSSGKMAAEMHWRETEQKLEGMDVNIRSIDIRHERIRQDIYVANRHGAHYSEKTQRFLRNIQNAEIAAW
ncbi:35966_t:CDS:2 [Gigaspora margarita]|uniref:35966_t:CDS:1 n=1 Tax=Gigaspora margarita TaxID=4874 RepID=A0ABN7UBQ6_GIGMA|nr:35966_t:CDS:2 [Gigaspora margarita]